VSLVLSISNTAKCADMGNMQRLQLQSHRLHGVQLQLPPCDASRLCTF
jgi:hypothetical protein